MTTFILPINDPAATDADTVGPKAANLAALMQAGLPTPGGFALSAAAYNHQIRHLGIEELLRAHPDVAAEADTGYQGLARDFPAQVSAPPKKPGKDASPEDTARWEQQRHQQSSQRICIEHAIAEPKQWRSLQRYLGRREHFQETALAIAGLVSDRAAAR